MEEEQYCLKWNNHQSTLLTVLTGLMDSEKLADCMLSAEGRTIKSHQVVISACSPYLEKLLNDSRQPGLMPILVFSDLAFDELVALKEYMYKGEVNIRQNSLDSFLKAAHSLQIKGLADGGGGGGDDGGGGGKRKADPDSTPGAARRRRRRESRESDPNSLDEHTQQSPIQHTQQVPVKKQNVFSSSSNFDNPPAPQVKLEPVETQIQMPQPQQIQPSPQVMMKAEPHDQPETHDLTGVDDDDYEGYEMPGTSQPDLSQDMSNWQMDNSMNSEDFAASQSVMAAQPGQSSQDEPYYKNTYVCGTCKKGFRFHLSLVEHLKTDCKKTMIPSFACTECKARFRRKHLLERHVSLCHVPTDMWFKCDFCQYATKRRDNIKTHMKAKHSEKANPASKSQQ